MLKRILNKLRCLRNERHRRVAIAAEAVREEQLVMDNIPHGGIDELTVEEKSRFDSLWAWTGLAPSYREIGMFKHYRGFDSRYLTHYQYLPIVAHLINNYKWTLLFEHKSLLGYLAKGKMRFPETYVRCVAGELYNGAMEQIDVDAAVKECEWEYPVIVKDSTGTSGGISVRRICTPEELRSVIVAKRRDFLVQECLTQHPSFAKFNPTSINTLRVTTLYLNGRFSVLSIILRMGKQGASVDNWRGGILVGVDLDGRLHETGYDINLNKFSGVNGIAFVKETLSQVPSLLEPLEDAHKHQFPLSKFIGWDIAFNAENEPVIIELNSSQPGVIGEQLCTGPIFGDRTDEVIEYCKKQAAVKGGVL